MNVKIINKSTALPPCAPAPLRPLKMQPLDMTASNPELNSDWIKYLPGAKAEYKALYGEEWEEPLPANEEPHD